MKEGVDVVGGGWWLIGCTAAHLPSAQWSGWCLSVSQLWVGGIFAVHRTTDALADAGENASKWRVKTK